jgi:type II secretory pathway component PulM
MTPFSLKELSKKCRAAFNQAMDSTQLTSNVAQQTKLSQAGGSRGFASALNFAHTKRKLLLSLAVLAMLWALMQFWAAPYVQRLEGQMLLRPMQWAQLENLIKLSKSKPMQLNNVVLVDEAELQKIRNILIARGLKPSVLRLGVENPPRIELQASDVMFAVVVDVLEELRSTWRLYPERIELVATSSTAVVNLSASLVQTSASSYSSNVSMLEGALSK